MLQSLMPRLGTFDLIAIGIRLFVLVFIIKWVRRKITGSTAVTIIILALSYLLLFRWAGFWLPILILIIVLPHGPLDLMFDLALGGGGGEAKKKKESVRKRKRS